ncbi:MAG: hypothetical protein A3E01_17675 [Gammaproteobacteria bacterium RIFCSPHIGHO2_12_FULL_63_22]|nr:MAG: hypothetical protein A3E01_17675 [Gammaproteobacteria bacterium RIFCSPHIGHO2_12_FULL_63_22]
MTPKTQAIVATGSLVLLGIPLAFVATLLLYPFWNWLEAQTGIESMGHSGPATWCFVAVYVAMLLACYVGARRAIRRALQSSN